MGGDHGPSIVLAGVAKALQSHPAGGLRFLLHGEMAAMRAVLPSTPGLANVCELRPSDGVISMDAKPAHAMRRGKGTSMWNAVESVKTGEARAAVSAGNTGALMAISQAAAAHGGRPRSARPGGQLADPARRHRGARRRRQHHLRRRAAGRVRHHGRGLHRAVHGSARPTVGLLNVGSEDREGPRGGARGRPPAARTCSFDLDYRGFVEGDDIAKGAVDVVVTDGFTGNVALKTAEGLARFFRSELRQTLTESPLARARRADRPAALRRMSARLDPSAINGGPFLGLNGIVVKSHGGADARGFATAIRLAADLAAKRLRRPRSTEQPDAARRRPRPCADEERTMA